MEQLLKICVIVLLLASFLFSLSVMQGCDVDLMQRVAYTCRQLNSSSTSLRFFNFVVLCCLEQIEDVKSVLLKCFDAAEITYAYDKSAQGLLFCA